MCFAQQHLKRLLAFSTIAHMGVVLSGVGLLDGRALGGAARYVLGHGLVKGALFLTAGIYLHRLRSVYELALRGRGSAAPGALFALGGLALAGAPPFGTFRGEAEIDAVAQSVGYGWLSAVFAIAASLTAGAVLRAAARITFGWGPSHEVEDVGGETSERPETTESRALPVAMWAPSLALLVLAAVLGVARELEASVRASALRFEDTQAYAARVLDAAHAPLPSVADGEGSAMPIVRAAVVTAAAALLAVGALFRERIPLRVRELARAVGGEVMHRLRRLQSGHVGDYVTWLTVGAACFGALCAVLLA